MNLTPNIDQKKNSGTRFINNIAATVQPIIQWEYIPYNFESISNNKKFQDELKKLGIDLSKLTDYTFVKGYKDSITKAYKKTGDLNENSMIVFSLPKCKGGWRYIPVSCQYNFPCNHIYNCYRYHEYCRHLMHCPDDLVFPPGCLYTGDYNAYYNFKDGIKKVFDTKENLIGTVQIPHHGSGRSYNDALIRPGKFYPVSYGDNHYGHPDYNIINDIFTRDGVFIPVKDMRFMSIWGNK